jgi:hypothetical protein
LARLLIGIALAGYAWLWMTGHVLAVPEWQEGDPWFAINVNRAVVDWFDEVAGPRDIAWTGPGTTDLLDQIQIGRRQIAFRTAEEAEATLPDVAANIDLVYYDLGPWAEASLDAQSELLDEVRALRRLANAHDLSLALGVDWRTASESGSVLAENADVVVLQAYRIQNDPLLIEELVLPVIGDLHQLKPELEVGVQLRIEESMEQLSEALTMLHGDIDGISILYTPMTLVQMQQFVDAMRSGQMGVDGEVLAEQSPLPTPWFLTPEADSTPSPSVRPIVAPALPFLRCTWPTGLVLGASGYLAVKDRRQREEGSDEKRC